MAEQTFSVESARSLPSSGLKARDYLAQGNALGIRHPSYPMRPEGPRYRFFFWPRECGVEAVGYRGPSGRKPALRLSPLIFIRKVTYAVVFMGLTKIRHRS